MIKKTLNILGCIILALLTCYSSLVCFILRPATEYEIEYSILSQRTQQEVQLYDIALIVFTACAIVVSYIIVVNTILKRDI